MSTSNEVLVYAPARCDCSFAGCSSRVTGPEKVRLGGTARNAEPWEPKALAARPCQSAAEGSASRRPVTEVGVVTRSTWDPRRW